MIINPCIIYFQVTSMADLPPPIIQIGPANQTLPLHSVVTLYCKATSPEGNPPTVRWLKDNKVLQVNNLPNRYSISPTGTLDIDGKQVNPICEVNATIARKRVRNEQYSEQRMQTKLLTTAKLFLLREVVYLRG